MDGAASSSSPGAPLGKEGTVLGIGNELSSPLGVHNTPVLKDILRLKGWDELQEITGPFTLLKRPLEAMKGVNDALTLVSPVAALGAPPPALAVLTQENQTIFGQGGKKR